jgi:two-component system phosphate regulon sensor histidine kinase PhoR
MPEGVLMLNADPVHLSNILHNLLDNAVKYGGNNPEITIGGRRKGDQFYMYVADEGPGISKEHQDHLFEKFYRVPTGDVHDVKGFGLGLFYVYQICRAHGWTIRVESKEGEGTTFHLRMPLLAVDKPAAANVG